jgi:uncharacterized phage-associated protein
MPQKLTADQVADYLISLAHERGESVNNMKLQRLLYYAQAWHLGIYDEPLFVDTIQAWMTGPVIPTEFWRFAPFGIHDIPSPAVRPELSAETKEFLDAFALEFLPLDEWQLESSCRHEPPWMNARWGAEIDPPCYEDISESDMRTYFRQLRDAA